MPLHNQARLEALYNSWVVYWRAPFQQHEQQRQLKLQLRQEEQHRTKAAKAEGKACPIDPGLKMPAMCGATGGTGGGGGGDRGRAGKKGGDGVIGIGQEESDDEIPTRAEALRERMEKLREAVMAAATFTTVVLKGSLWQPLVSAKFEFCCQFGHHHCEQVNGSTLKKKSLATRRLL